MASPPSSAHPPKRLKMFATCNSTADEAEPAPGSSAAPSDPSDAKPQRFKRRKVAIFLSYCGAGYQGMQKNPGARTIEGELEEALFLAGAVPVPDRGKPKSYDWARAARTDKGVSAAGQVVSGRFYIDPPGLVDRLNSILSKQIRVWGFKRVTASFNAKKFCDCRRYVYLLPVFALDPNAHPDRESATASMGSENELARCLECSERGRKVVGLMGRQQRKTLKEEECSELGGNERSKEEEISELGGNERSKEEESSELGGNESGMAVDVDACDSIVNQESLLRNEGLGDEGQHELEGMEIKSGDGKGDNSMPNLDSFDANRKIETRIETFELCKLEVSLPGEANVIEGHPVLENRVSAGDGEKESTAVIVYNGEKVSGTAGEFCYGDKERENFNRILNRYVGTHNFHNFTTRTKAEDPSARRYIISFNADYVVSIGGIDFVKCEVIGQSFMLHQIRKMIGLAVALMRNCAPESFMDIALRQDVNINVPTAPEVGLYLDECLFSSYNKKWKDSHEALTMEAYEGVEEFKLKHIYSHITSMEYKEGSVALWLHSLNHRNYPDFRMGESKGEHATIETSK